MLFFSNEHHISFVPDSVTTFTSIQTNQPNNTNEREYRRAHAISAKVNSILSLSDCKACYSWAPHLKRLKNPTNGVRLSEGITNVEFFDYTNPKNERKRRI